MAAVATQIEIDGPRNTVSKTSGDFAMTTLPTAVTLVDPSVLTSMLPAMSGTWLAQTLRIDHIDYSISDGLTVQLFWDATTPVLICELYGRGKLELAKFGGWQNNAGAGITGKITMTVIITDSASTAGTGSLLLNIWTVKQRTQSVGGA